MVVDGCVGVDVVGVGDNTDVVIDVVDVRVCVDVVFGLDVNDYVALISIICWWC